MSCWMPVEDVLRQRILHFRRNLRCLSRNLMQFLQKYIIFADFYLHSISMASIPAVSQQFRQPRKRHKGMLYFRSIIGKSPNRAAKSGAGLSPSR